MIHPDLRQLQTQKLDREGGSINTMLEINVRCTRSLALCCEDNHIR